MIKMIILDRDGVINEDSDEYIKSSEEWIPIKGSIEAIARLKKANFLTVVATNQSGIARGYFDEIALRTMHDKLDRLLAQRGSAIDGIFYCPHSPTDNCICRKPKPGLLLQIFKQFAIKPDESLFVGDTLSDIQAAQMAGSQPVLVKTGKGAKTLETHGPFDNIPLYDDLAHFTREFLRNYGNPR